MKHFIKKFTPLKGRGCSYCGKSGHKGRVAVHEVLLMTEPIKRSILSGSAAIDIKKVAMSTGMKTLRQSALAKMASGLVCAQEVVKTTSSDTEKKSISKLGRK